MFHLQGPRMTTEHSCVDEQQSCDWQFAAFGLLLQQGGALLPVLPLRQGGALLLGLAVGFGVCALTTCTDITPAIAMTRRDDTTMVRMIVFCIFSPQLPLG